MGFFSKLVKSIEKAREERGWRQFDRKIEKTLRGPLDKARADLERFNRPKF